MSEKYRFLPRIVLAMLAGTVAAAETKAEEAPPRILSFAERPSAIYKTGETVRFKIWMVQPKVKRFMDPELKDVTVLPGEKIDYELTGDGGYRKTGSIVSGRDAVHVEGALPRPGFLLLKLTATKNGHKLTRYAGAGVEPEKLVSGTKMPADFEAYWAGEIAKLRARKPKITVREATEKMTADTKYLAKIYDVRIEDGDINASGILTIPLHSGKKKLPAVITFGGASWLGANPHVTEAVSRGAMVFAMNIHDTKNHIANQSETQALRRHPAIQGYQYHHLTDRDKYAPRKIFLRIVRSLDYLKSRPEWDGRVLIAKGPSFGGCQTIVAAALDKDVTACFPGGPAMCDHLGALNNQNAGWPQLLTRKEYNASPEGKKLAAENSAYFDAANMARLIRCPTVFSVGFIDTVCPPTSVYAAYNNVPGNRKKILHGTRAEHGASTLPGEPGAFSAEGDPLYRELCNGTEMLINGSFDYRRNGTGKDAKQLLPFGWECRNAAVEVRELPDSPSSCYLRMSDGARVFQGVWNLRRKAGKVVLEGKMRGKGELNVMLTGATPPMTVRFPADNPERWQKITHTFQLPDNSYGLTLQFSATGSIDLDALTLNTEK